MTAQEILSLRDHGEVTKVQFKERVTRDNKYDVSCEMVAQSNTHGGLVVVGINDKTGAVNPLSFQEVQETTNLLGNIASEGVVPSVNLDDIVTFPVAELASTLAVLTSVPEVLTEAISALVASTSTWLPFVAVPLAISSIPST